MKIKVWDSMTRKFIERLNEANPFVWSGYKVVMITATVYLASEAEFSDAVDAISIIFKDGVTTVSEK